MRVTLTPGSHPLVRQLAASLAGSTTVRLVDEHPLSDTPPDVELLTGDVRDPDFAAAAVAGSEALVDLRALDAGEQELEALDRASRGTYVLLLAARAAGVRRVALGSTLAYFQRLPGDWRIGEGWRPRPRPVVEQLAPWVAELSARELSRTGDWAVVCLRLGNAGAGPWRLTGEEAVAALRRAIQLEPGRNGWHLFHVTSDPRRASLARRRLFGEEAVEKAGGEERPTTKDEHQGGGAYVDWRAVLAPRDPIPSRPIRSVVVFGAGGPVAAEAARIMAADYRLRLTDVRPLEEILRAGQPQSRHAPLPEPLGAPHEMRVVDVTDPAQVLAACEGMDAILNCTVIRRDPVEAFRVNTLGALNIAKAAVAHRIRRLVQTGPQLVSLTEGYGYAADYDVPGDAPPRPGDHLYGHSKFLGQEILRAFAEEHGLEVPVLLFCNFINARQDPRPAGIGPFTTSWEDAAYAIRRAVEVPSFPSPYEVMNVNADLPHGKYSTEKACRLLGWQPRDGLEQYWIGERPEGG